MKGSRNQARATSGFQGQPRKNLTAPSPLSQGRGLVGTPRAILWALQDGNGAPCPARAQSSQASLDGSPHGGERGEKRTEQPRPLSSAPTQGTEDRRARVAGSTHQPGSGLGHERTTGNWPIQDTGSDSPGGPPHYKADNSPAAWGHGTGPEHARASVRGHIEDLSSGSGHASWTLSRELGDQPTPRGRQGRLRRGRGTEHHPRGAQRARA